VVQDFRIALHLVLLIGILTAFPGAAACRSGGIRVGSWEEAIQFAQAELDATGDLEGRLERYDLTAVRLSAKIDALDQARSALDLIGKLRDVQVPLVGNGWQILLALLSLATVDGAKAIGTLEETLRLLTELKHSLDYLNGVSALAESVRVFRENPTRRNLMALSSFSGSATPSLRRLQADLGEVLEPLEDVAGNLSTLVKGLRSVADAGVPVVSDAALESADKIGRIEGTLFTLNDGLSELYQDIGADAEVLERIEEAVRQAKEHGE
jgi:hypothetical protein